MGVYLLHFIVPIAFAKALIIVTRRLKASHIRSARLLVTMLVGGLLRFDSWSSL
jgi:hypothetical protein